MDNQIKKIKIKLHILIFIGFFALSSTRTQAYYWGNTLYGTVIVAIMVALSGIVLASLNKLEKEISSKEE